MKPRLAWGLVVMFALSICLQAHATSEDSDYHYDDEYDDEYDDSYGDEDQSSKADSDKLPSSLTTTTTSTTTEAPPRTTKTTAAPLWSDEDDVREDYPCPRDCSCEDGTRFINCSQLGITDVPTDLPRNVIRLDLSGNNIKHVQVDAFQNCTDVRELLLGRNVIEELEKEVFLNLVHLDVVALDGNQLGHLTPDTFVEAQSLRRLVLNENPLVIPDDGPFLQQEELEELEMAGCNLTELNHQTFGGLEALKSLNLAGNEFDEDLSTDVFEPLVNLQRLHLPPLSEDTVRDLCDVVKSIDVVDITTHNISCFYLASETSYEESIITQRPITPVPKRPEPKDLDLPETGGATAKPTKGVLKKENEIDPGKEESKTTTPRPSSTVPSRRSSSTTTTTTTAGSPTVSGPSSASITHSAAGEGVKKESNPEGSEDQSLLASISSETMKQLLMGIIGAGVLILMIGIICRRTGLKNKFCGSKRRPAPTDQVRPAEEVPLNKV